MIFLVNNIKSTNANKISKLIKAGIQQIKRTPKNTNRSYRNFSPNNKSCIRIERNLLKINNSKNVLKVVKSKRTLEQPVEIEIQQTSNT